MNIICLTVGANCLSGKNNCKINFNKIILKLCNKNEGNFGITTHYATAAEMSLHCEIKPNFETFSTVFSNNTLSTTL